MRILKCATVAGLLMVLGGVSGCRGTPESKFYALVPVESGPTHETRRLEGVTVGVGPIALPKILDRPQLVTRVGTNEFRISESRRWAEPLDESFSQVLSENIARLLGTDRVVSFPWARSAAIDYRVTLDVTRFDGSEARETSLVARWKILGPDSEVLQARRATFTQPIENGESHTLVTGMNRNLEELSRALATQLTSLHRIVEGSDH